MFEPIDHLFERSGLQLAGAPLSFAPTGYEPGAFEHFEMPGDGRQADVERCRQVLNRGLTGHETGEDSAPSRVGQGAEGGTETVCRHIVFCLLLS